MRCQPSAYNNAGVSVNEQLQCRDMLNTPVHHRCQHSHHPSLLPRSRLISLPRILPSVDFPHSPDSSHAFSHYLTVILFDVFPCVVDVDYLFVGQLPVHCASLSSLLTTKDDDDDGDDDDDLTVLFCSTVFL